MANKFDFEVAQNLENIIRAAETTLDTQNEELKKRFAALRDFIRDSGYDDLSREMAIPDAAVRRVVDQMGAVSQHIHEYAQRLRDVM